MTCASRPLLHRCALYTRKSSEDGLDQEFNSLDAQREACAAYVKSQSSEGWKAVPTLYDDGGHSGGTMERPALQRLLADITADHVDIVVVYKIDRLTRSLADFARMIEIFERHDVSFVSVTQSFNTTSSMGRLTLNMLLSFAQFEREITGERIRDKIEASKKKGLWMGGNLPLGYDLPIAGSRVLVVNPHEAEIVRRIFSDYLDRGSVHALAVELRQAGIVSKLRTTAAGRQVGGHPFSRGALFHLLRNRTYRGEIPHRKTTYPGQHDAIVDAELFEAVQTRLDANARRRRKSRDRTASSMFTGRIFDVEGQPMTPTYAYGRNRRLYRYYVSADIQQGRHGNGRAERHSAPRRISAQALETLLQRTLNRLVPDVPDDPTSRISRIEVHRAHLDLTLPLRLLRSIRPNLAEGETAEPDPADRTSLRLTLPARLRIRSGKSEIIDGAADAPKPDPVLIEALRKAHAMLDTTTDGTRTLDVAPTSPYRRRLIRLAFLAPDLQRAILAGRQPPGMSLAALMNADLPHSWVEQRRIFGSPRTA